MAEATTPLAAVLDEFEDARGVALDGLWAHAVAWRLMRRDVEPAQVCDGLEEALRLVRDTHEAPEVLFGEPAEHADALYDRWVEEGRLHLWDASRMTWREVPSSGLAWAAYVVLAFMAIFLVKGETSRTWTFGMILLPVGIGFATVAVAACWDSLLRTRGQVGAAVGTAAAGGTLAMAMSFANEWSKAHPFGAASVWWYVPVAAACALLSTVWRRWLQSRPVAPAPSSADVDNWSRELAAILRSRHSMSDVRVRTIIGDAHAHAADAGRSVQEEFGTPTAYAARFEPDLLRRSRLTAVFWLVIAVLWLVPLTWGFSWGNVAAALLCGGLARGAHRKQPPPPQSGR